jgi:hypothetical protein
MSIGLIVPTYGAFGYAKRTVESFLEHTPGVENKCYVIDDASLNWPKLNWNLWPAHVMAPPNCRIAHILGPTPTVLDDNTVHDTRVLCYHFKQHQGLTRSWNAGLRIGHFSSAWRCDYLICGNSDILFTPGWQEPLLSALEDFDLVGPTTNAPGRVTHQNVKHFYKGYKLTDDPEYLAATAQHLRDKYDKRVFRSYRINGFFMMAKAHKWWDRPHDAAHVFNPKHNMADVAYMLQARWRRQERKIGIVPQSFIFHYRSVSRGNVGLRGNCGSGALRIRKQ